MVAAGDVGDPVTATGDPATATGAIVGGGPVMVVTESALIHMYPSVPYV